MEVANRPSSGDEQRALQDSQLLTVVSKKMITPAGNRRQEAEADLLGVDLLVRAEYSPVAMVTMLEKYQAWEKQTKEADEAFQARAGEVMKKDVAEGVKMTLRSEEHTSELQSRPHLVCRLLLEKKKNLQHL